jgi:hypothetical protein
MPCCRASMACLRSDPTGSVPLGRLVRSPRLLPTVSSGGDIEMLRRAIVNSDGCRVLGTYCGGNGFWLHRLDFNQRPLVMRRLTFSDFDIVSVQRRNCDRLKIVPPGRGLRERLRRGWEDSSNYPIANRDSS